MAFLNVASGDCVNVTSVHDGHGGLTDAASSGAAAIVVDEVVLRFEVVKEGTDESRFIGAKRAGTFVGED